MQGLHPTPTDVPNRPKGTTIRQVFRDGAIDMIESGLHLEGIREVLSGRTTAAVATGAL
jgi:hypothetical protein